MKLLFVTSRFPWPLDKGDKLRAFNHIRVLSKEHEIVLFSISEERVQQCWIDALKPYCKSIKVFRLSKLMIIRNILSHFFSGLPLQSTYYYNRNISKSLKAFTTLVKPGKIIFQLLRTTLYASLFKEKNCVIDLMDCFSYHYFLRSKNANIFSYWFYNREYRTLIRYESKLLKKYRHLIIISERDKTLLPGNNKHVQVVGNGIEEDHTPFNSEKTCDLLFLGNLRYKPNISAAKFLENKIVPLLSKIKPDISITIAGIEAKRHFENQHNIQVLEDIENTTPVFLASRIFVAPMFLSTGIQNKILEAMAHGIPVITTPNACDALGALNNHHLLTAVSAQEFSDQIVKLLNNKWLYNLLTINAKKFINNNYDWEQNTRALGCLIIQNSNIPKAAEV